MDPDVTDDEAEAPEDVCNGKTRGIVKGSPFTRLMEDISQRDFSKIRVDNNHGKTGFATCAKTLIKGFCSVFLIFR